MESQNIINECEGLTFEEKTPILLSKLAKGELDSLGQKEVGYRTHSHS